MDGFQVTRPLTARISTAARTRAALTVSGAVPPPGVLARFRLLVAQILDTMEPDFAQELAMFRDLVAGVLDALNPEWEVHPLPVDSLTPPAFMLEWADPWMTPATHCLDTARLEIIAVAARIEPDPGIETLEVMVESALGALNRAGIPHGETSAPRPFEIGGLTYLACRIQVSNHVNVGASSG